MYLALAIAISAGVVLSAPFTGQVRGLMRSALPGQFAWIVNVVVGAAAATAVIVTFKRSARETRLVRYMAIAAAGALAAVAMLIARSGAGDVDAVERVHFVEYGVISWLFYRVWRTAGDATVLALPALACLIVGVVEEWFQWFVPVRIGEIRDVFLNGGAIASGLLASVAIDPPRLLSVLRPGGAKRIAGLTAAFVLALAAFVQIVHLGVEVRDPAIGAFRSRYDAEQLQALARDRAVRWSAAPPIELRRFSREDQYFNEGIWHVQARNAAWAGSNPFVAWKENLLLEAYFAPVLDAPSYVSPTGHRWPAEQRADADRKAGRSTRSFVSHAERSPIVLWPPLPFWALAVSAAALILQIGSAAERRRAS